MIERGVNRSLGDWEDYAKILRRKSEQKAAEAEQAGAGADVGQLKIASLQEKSDGIAYDASPGEVLAEELVKKARTTEMEKHGVCAKVPVECWRVTGKKPTGVEST